MTYQGLEEQEQPVRETLDSIRKTQKQPSWTTLNTHLAENYPEIHSQFNRVDQDGFHIVGRHPFDRWPPNRKEHSGMGIEARTTEQLLVIARLEGIATLSSSGRTRLAEFWVSEVQSDLSDNLYEHVKMAENLRRKLTNVHDEVDHRVLQTADVIGVTTTGLAKRIKALQHVPGKILICEEAGEIVEPHFLTALLPNVEHMISIGDHRQLRPQINNCNLPFESQAGAPYQLDRSQFERLSVGEPGRPPFPVSQLNVQRRMRPQISNLIRATVYPRLIDHESTRNIPDVIGMRSNVFFLDHQNLEDGCSNDNQQKSHSNAWEVDMTHALVRHIVRQGVYSSSDIAVLTPYTGQLQALRAKFHNEFEIVLSDRDEEALTKEGFIDGDLGGSNDLASQSEKKPLAKKHMSELLRLATVDNFQGEEAKVVIVSLVRSNHEKKVGFLKTSNRINALLSRAQHGLYLIGNAETYSNVSMWNDVLGLLRADDAKEVASWLAVDASAIAAISAWLDAIRNRCTESFLVQSLASAFTTLAAIPAKSQHAEKTAMNVW
ncbi:hypothetical protein IFR05_013742 [Cadophora sp. M221]|nr:hypothetical protein IFR05_013742 [Cadophora sp. M221]